MKSEKLKAKSEKFIRFFILALLLSGLMHSMCVGQDSIRAIPEDALYNYYRLQIGDFSIQYHEKTYFPNHYDRYYSPNASSPTILISPNELGNDSTVADTLKSYVGLHLVNENLKLQKVTNPHDLDPKLRKYLTKARSLGLIIRQHDPRILHQLDSLKLYRQVEVDAFISNLKLFESTDGFLYTSPNGNHVVMIGINTLTYQYNEACDIALFHNRKSSEDLPVIAISFKSWMASPNPLDYFWISNSELVFKAMPIRQFMKFANGHCLETEVPFQWIKLTIL